ncbi:hypothetical protein BDA99DRAFT_561890 [Phascolomyces articulosus]|uniref:DASH complex subunit DAD1 n=1 Tax=Phascolomyces articulosus TaxID=60185 RepID=A0AAD5PBJ3_9FUNG|nr:hypothetical protein BDA99DRAFT_561890 [Phascolomyces articulosus]
MDANRTLKTFDIERGRLLREARQELTQLVAHLNNLNQNIQTLNSIATGFREPSNLWHDFHAALKPEPEETTGEQDIIY